MRKIEKGKPMMSEIELSKWYETAKNYYKGDNGVEQNYTEAVKWFKKAAEQGQAKAQYNTAMGLRFLSQALFYDKIKLNHPNIK